MTMARARRLAPFADSEHPAQVEVYFTRGIQVDGINISLGYRLDPEALPPASAAYCSASAWAANGCRRCSGRGNLACTPLAPRRSPWCRAAIGYALGARPSPSSCLTSDGAQFFVGVALGPCHARSSGVPKNRSLDQATSGAHRKEGTPHRPKLFRGRHRAERAHL